MSLSVLQRRARSILYLLRQICQSLGQVLQPTPISLYVSLSLYVFLSLCLFLSLSCSLYLPSFSVYLSPSSAFHHAHTLFSLLSQGWDRLEVVSSKQRAFLDLADAFASRFIHHVKVLIHKQVWTDRPLSSCTCFLMSSLVSVAHPVAL